MLQDDSGKGYSFPQVGLLTSGSFDTPASHTCFISIAAPAMRTMMHRPGTST